MPNRILKESVWTSPNLNSISIDAQWLFFRLLPAPDDSGCFEATSLVVKGRCLPLMDKIKLSDIEKWYVELEAADLIRFWSDNGRKFGYFPQWEKHQRIRSVHQRKTPIPPNDVTCRQMTANDGLNPNLNPNPNPKDICSSNDELFDVFWLNYPRKVGKEAARKAWKKIKAQTEVIEKMKKVLPLQKHSEQWTKDNGQYIPYPATYLNEGRWEDETIE